MLTQQMANEIHDVHEDAKDTKQIITMTQQPATLRSSDTLVQHMPLKPDDIVEITQLLMEEKTSRVYILGPGRMGNTSVSLSVVEQPHGFHPKTMSGLPCIKATLVNLLYAYCR